MSDLPLVSVLMPVYNGEKFLEEAIESIVGQSWSDFEFLIVNDGSTDGTSAILERYERMDRRITVYQQENRGLIATLNRGLHLAKGKYIARMDADDISLPSRLEEQIETLESNPGLALIGSAYEIVDVAGRLIRIDRQPVQDTDIRWQMLFKNAFAHSSVTLRLETLRRNGLSYEEWALHGEDYELWSRLLLYGRGQNSRRALIKRRQHPQQVSSSEADSMERMAACISGANLDRLGIEVSDQEIPLLRKWYGRFPTRLESKDLATCRKMLEILNAFGRQPQIDRKVYHRIRARWLLRFLAVPGYAMGHFWKRDLLKQIQLWDLLAILALVVKRTGL